MKRTFSIVLLIIGASLLLCVISAFLAPQSFWLYQHNYYFQAFADFLHGR